MREIRVRDWKDLIEILYEIPPNRFQRHRSDFVYRGVGDASWDLHTSLMRMGRSYLDVEGPMLLSFRKYAEPGSLPSKSLWMELAVAQHHGLPTRLLDWSLSPRVATHFATAEDQHYDKDAAIWCVDVTNARKMLPRDLRVALEIEHAWLFSIDMLQHIKTLRELDAQNAAGPFVLFFEPPSLDSRIVNQSAVMSVMPGAALSLGEFLNDHPDLSFRIVIPKELKWEIRDKLDQDNVTERMLFPGLDSLSRWLKRYYGPGPLASPAVAAANPTDARVTDLPPDAQWQ